MVSRALSSRFPFSLLAGAAGASVFAASVVFQGAAYAAVIDDAVKRVEVVESSASPGSGVTVVVDWAVPDGARRGDTFTLTLPTMLVADVLDGVHRDVKAPDGAVVARYEVHGQTVNFTMTEFADEYVGVHGTVRFGVRLSRSIQPGSSSELVFLVNGVAFSHQDEIVAVAPPAKGDYSESATKWQTWKSVGEDKRGRIQWGITGPRVPRGMVTASYRIVDEAGPGQAIDCSSLTLWSGSANEAGGLKDARWVPVNLYSKSCDEKSASAVVTPDASLFGRVLMLMGGSRVTDRALSAYRNSGYVSVWDTAPLRVSDTLLVEATGEGTGTPAVVPSVTITNPAISPAVTVTVPPAPPTVTVTPIAPNPQERPSMPSAGPITGAPVKPIQNPQASVTPSSPSSSTSKPAAVSVVNRGVSYADASPSRIETGQPGDGPNVPMLAAGGVLIASSVGVLAAALRSMVRRRRI
ncbi:Ig-like domain-containing protein [Dermatophilus congolensis]|uniref:Ig-like domain-containing protein n=1 Tax=Dermatophilus congolensis TaxID=1863 RepID=UPI001AAF9D49|nr:Ig-like domain-containing protein [Dermatophilus congolensis]MBO3142474.1 hypothetical protein [Dermatophilus congolensis]MBO3151463.1 hypothetical protein [Dermatophilus congolensis]MBO3161533.1 hypothetical protein [Dermatophilus congolensis]MBO3162749.1 hypothetical protein [Dermatophilus congolensis]MBO3176303.1 hypothetical protein [Dermatophilus congolensis]